MYQGIPNSIQKLKRKFKSYLKKKKELDLENYKPKLVVFTGAGISAESGISTFRDSNGLWNNHKVEDVASPNGLKKNPELVFNFYNERRKKIKEAQPNNAHKILAELEEHFNVVVITQNIDDLHERAGSSNVIHLHGSINEKRSIANPNLIYELKEDEFYNLEERCPKGNCMLRPNIVFFGEQVPEFPRAKRELYGADIFMVIGTSLQVYPAADLALYIPNFVDSYLIDKNITEDIKSSKNNFTFIEDVASNGMVELKEGLIDSIKTIKERIKNQKQ